MKNYFKNNYKLILIKLSIIIIALLIDLLSKWLIQKHFANGGDDITIIKGVLSFTYTENTGVAWSLFSGKRWGIVITSLLFVGIIVVWDYFNSDKNFFNVAGISLIMSGALGNLIDRMFLGYVRDFIAADFIDFPIFNFADICITVGCIFYVVYLIFYSNKKDKKGESDARV